MSNPGNGAVHRAVMRRSLDEVARAVEGGARVDDLDQGGRTALFYAALEGRVDILAKLLEHGARTNIRDKAGKTPLHFAASGYQPAAVRLLLDHGAEIDAQDAHGNTPLSDAVYESMGRGDVIGILLQAGADRTLPNNHGVSPASLAHTIANYDV